MIPNHADIYCVRTKNSQGLMKQFSLLVLILALSGCETFLPAHDKSFKVDQESVFVKIESVLTKRQDKTCEPGKAGKKEAAVAALVIPLLADYAIKNVAQELAKDSERYTAEYGGTTTSAEFYQSADCNPDVNFKQVVIRREITLDGKETIASEIFLDVVGDELEKNGHLQLVAKTPPLLNYSKAKVLGTRWYLPWTWFGISHETVDMDVNVIIEAQWLDENAVSHNEAVANLIIPLRKVPFGKPSTNKQAYQHVPSTWFAPIPRSILSLKGDKGKQYGTGTYVVKVKVTEFDDFGKRVKKLSNYIESNRAGWVTKVKDAVTDKE